MARTSDEAKGKVVDTGIKMAVGAGGTIVGTLLAGPLGGVAGATISAASGPLVEHIAISLRQRFSQREQERVDAALRAAVIRIEERRQAGDELRQDDFFAAEVDDRSAADEVFEAVMRAAQVEVEEKKLHLLGNLLGNVAFHPEIDRAEANHLIRLAADLSYQQLCLLELYSSSERYNFRYKYIHADTEPTYAVLQSGTEESERYKRWHEERSATKSADRAKMTPAHFSIAHEVIDLHSRGLLVVPGSQGTQYQSSREIGLGSMEHTKVGQLLHELMNLSNIKPEDLERAASLLRQNPQSEY